MALPQLRVNTVLPHTQWFPPASRSVASAVEPVEHRPALFPSSPLDGPQDPFGTLSVIFASHNKSAEFWWCTTGAAFAQMLQGAFYPLHQQYRYLVFYYLIILPEFGPAPSLGLPLLEHTLRDPPKTAHPRWPMPTGLPTPPYSSSPAASTSAARFRSYMTDDHSPIELSWLFDSEGGAVVRFAIDPVRRQLEGDPRGAIGLFEDLAGMKVLARGVDLEWCRVCAALLTLSDAPRTAPAGKGAPEYPSQYFVGFDFSSLGIVMKAYFLPETRAALTSTPKSTLITSCITALSTPSPACPSPPDLLTPWHRVLSFFHALPEHLAPVLNIVAVDCVSPRHNRVKVYARTPRATLTNLRRFLTLDRDPALTSPATQRALAQITLMWRLLFPELSSPEHDDVEPPSAVPQHPTAGLLWYYELRAGHAEPFPKVYLPVRHWCRSDEHVVRVVEAFYREVGNVKAAERYARDVKQTFTHRPLSSRAGIHTYITFAAKANDVEVTSYFNPECYAPERGACPGAPWPEPETENASDRRVQGSRMTDVPACYDQGRAPHASVPLFSQAC